MTTGPHDSPSPSRYAALARRHWERWLPERLAEIPEGERDSFFSTLGEEISQKVESLELELRGPDLPGESFMERVGRFNMARLQAEERALSELLPVPEEEPEVPETPVMTDAEICWAHGLDEDDPSYEQQLAHWRAHYKAMGRRPGLP